jgi:hypothetical protein
MDQREANHQVSKLATFHLNELPNMPDHAACFILSDPVKLSGHTYEYLIVWITPAVPGLANAESAVLAATDTGSVAGPHMYKHAGFTLLDDYRPDDVTYVNGVYSTALSMLGYKYVPPEEFPFPPPPPTEPNPEPAQPDRPLFAEPPAGLVTLDMSKYPEEEAA